MDTEEKNKNGSEKRRKIPTLPDRSHGKQQLIGAEAFGINLSKEQLNKLLPSPRSSSSDKPLEQDVPAGFKLVPIYHESRSKKIQVMFTPTVMEKIAETATQLNISKNELVNQAVAWYLSKLDHSHE